MYCFTFFSCCVFKNVSLPGQSVLFLLGSPRPLQSRLASGLSALEGSACCRNCLFCELLAHFAALESGREYDMGLLCSYNVEKTQILERREMCLLDTF